MRLTDAQRAFVEEPRFGVLATVDPDGAPHQTVMWFLVEGDELVFNTASGRRKPANLARDRRVSLMIEDGYRFLRLSGRAREITDRATTQADIRRLAVRYNGEAAAASAMERQFSKEERITYRVPIERVYASSDLRT